MEEFGQIGNLVNEYYMKYLKGEASIELARKTLEPYFNLRPDDQSIFARSVDLNEFYKLNVPLNDIIHYNLCDNIDEWKRTQELSPLSSAEISEIEAIIAFQPQKKNLQTPTAISIENFSPNMVPTAVSTPLQALKKSRVEKLPSIIEENNDLMNPVVSSPPRQLSLPPQQLPPAIQPSQSNDEGQRTLNDPNFQNVILPERPTRNVVRSTSSQNYTQHEMLRTRNLDMSPEPLQRVTDRSEFMDFSDIDFDLYDELFARIPNILGPPKFEEEREEITVSRDRGHINIINLPESSGLDQIMSSTSEALHNTPEAARDMPSINVGSILKTTNDPILDSNQIANTPSIENPNSFLPVNQYFSNLPGIPDPVPSLPPTTSPPRRDWLQILRANRPIIDVNDIVPPKRKKPKRRNHNRNLPVIEPFPSFENLDWAEPATFSEAIRSLEPEQHFPDLAEMYNHEQYDWDKFLHDYNDWINIVADEYETGDSNYDIIPDNLEHSMETGRAVFEILKLVVCHKIVNSDLIFPNDLSQKDAAERVRVIKELQTRNILCVEGESEQIKCIYLDKNPLKKKSLFGPISSA